MSDKHVHGQVIMDWFGLVWFYFPYKNSIHTRIQFTNNTNQELKNGWKALFRAIIKMALFFLEVQK